MSKMLYCVAQGMDAVKVRNRVTYEHMGLLSIGEIKPNTNSEKAKSVVNFFEKTGVPYEWVFDMRKRMWGKFMFNVGLNQTVAIAQGNYGTVQKDGADRTLMITAMREVILLSEKEGVYLTEKDIEYWLEVLSRLKPESKPSMRQDMEAKRPTELELFAGTVLKLAEKHRVNTPVNRMFYKKITAMEKYY
jgi:2-dehydropantoate 2-reductase